MNHSSTDEPASSEGQYALPRLVVIELVGEDVMEWSQGQVTQDLRGLRPGDSTRGLICRPTGQIAAQLDIWRTDRGLLLLVDRLEVPVVLARLEEAVIMEDVSGQLLDVTVGHIVGPRPEGEARPRNRTGHTGFDVLGAEFVGEMPEAWTLAAGEPLPGVDYGEKTLPKEMGPIFEAATVSYAKGCYTGQEVLMRMQSRGRANRRWTGILSPVELAPDDEILSDGAVVGRITRAAWDPRLGFIAAATLRREAEGQSLSIRGTAVVAHDLPLS